ncbi:hypothetical protein DFH09DRAFT_1317056 [Mycena vulgaris]|nr:hypothetical protein DFH09DRAFT_1317056 [Mycena vulgaris]
MYSRPSHPKPFSRRLPCAPDSCQCSLLPSSPSGYPAYHSHPPLHAGFARTSASHRMIPRTHILLTSFTTTFVRSYGEGVPTHLYFNPDPELAARMPVALVHSCPWHGNAAAQYPPFRTTPTHARYIRRNSIRRRHILFPGNSP